ncbi:hypothetical protein AMECASPLE_013169 [Ameca splendens]|uniref:Uncharacterized protein n=1 Tax=Ameca splendens TaxID=208324 RepID=A0ABV0ZM30_9TELE
MRQRTGILKREGDDGFLEGGQHEELSGVCRVCLPAPSSLASMTTSLPPLGGPPDIQSFWSSPCPWKTLTCLSAFCLQIHLTKRTNTEITRPIHTGFCQLQIYGNKSSRTLKPRFVLRWPMRRSRAATCAR